MAVSQNDAGPISSIDSSSTEDSGMKDTVLKRGLKARHLQMISLGSAIGTGLFLGTGASIKLAGPVVLVGFAIAGSIVFLIMRMLGEMAVAHPVSGSFSAYAREFIGKLAGFIVGWNWWFTCIVVGILELTAAGVFLDFWYPHFPHWATALIALVVITLINLIQVGAFGETEFWMSMLKIVALVGMIVLGICLVLGIAPEPAIGFSNLWAHGGFAPTGLGGFMLSLVAVTFTFGGIQSIGTAAGEAEDPARTIPKAINNVLLRVIVFYVGGVGIMLLLYPWDKIDADSSPFVRVLVGIGIGGAATILNVVIIAAAMSVFNTMTFSGGRMLRDLALAKQAPKYFGAVSPKGIPVRAILFNSVLMGAAVLLNYLFQDKLIFALIAVILCAELITWSAIVVSHLRFRQRLIHEGGISSYPSPFSPIANYICLAYFAMLIVIMTFLEDYRVGLIALPIWLVSLLVIFTVQNAVRNRSQTLIGSNR